MKMIERQTTLLYLLRGQQILLAMKKRGFGVGKYNGIGGKVELGETVEQAMVRETQEEIGVTPLKYQKRGVLVFDQIYQGEHLVVGVHVFTSDVFHGEPKETEEMSPGWFDINQIPYNQMFQTDKLWLPILLDSHSNFNGTFKFNGDLDTKLIDYKLEIK